MFHVKRVTPEARSAVRTLRGAWLIGATARCVGCPCGATSCGGVRTDPLLWAVVSLLTHPGGHFRHHNPLWSVGPDTTTWRGFSRSCSQGADFAGAMRALTTRIMRTTQLDPEEIIEAMVRAKGNRSYAARRLGVARSTLIRAAHSLDLWPAIDERMAEEGFPVYPRPSDPLG